MLKSFIKEINEMLNRMISNKKLCVIIDEMCQYTEQHDLYYESLLQFIQYNIALTLLFHIKV